DGRLRGPWNERQSNDQNVHAHRQQSRQAGLWLRPDLVDFDRCNGRFNFSWVKRVVNQLANFSKQSAQWGRCLHELLECSRIGFGSDLHWSCRVLALRSELSDLVNE